MDFQQVRLVRESFAVLQPEMSDLAAQFYARLFARDPSLRSLFSSDMADQQRKFAAMLNLMIEYLDQPFKLHPVLARLGAQHQGYGVQADYYPVLGQVLVETVAIAYGSAWTPALETAWQALFRWMAREMQAGAFLAGSDAPP